MANWKCSICDTPFEMHTVGGPGENRCPTCRWRQFNRLKGVLLDEAKKFMDEHHGILTTGDMQTLVQFIQKKAENLNGRFAREVYIRPIPE